MRVVVTGGLGFIGSAVVRELVASTTHDVLVLDKMTYAATEGSIAEARATGRVELVVADIADEVAVAETFARFAPDAVMHLAAETHVDRSIDGPGAFLTTNVVGTYTLLDAARRHAAGGRPMRFHHVSTDEVFGTLTADAPPFDETSPYDPHSPYSATKAAADHLVRAWHDTYGLDTVITNCSNNYGPFHFPEKLIPLTILRALRGEELPVYGTGANVRDWLHVGDHARALIAVLERGRSGATYTIGGDAERTNLEVVEAVCDLVDEACDDRGGASRRALIRFVEDRPGHDLRYAIDATRIRTELGWTPTVTFAEGLRQTVRWYLENEWWWQPLLQERAATERLGLGAR